jgi:hypothetical protein
VRKAVIETHYQTGKKKKKPVPKHQLRSPKRHPTTETETKSETEIETETKSETEIETETKSESETETETFKYL